MWGCSASPAWRTGSAGAATSAAGLWVAVFLTVLTVLEKTQACSEPSTQSQCELLWMVLHGCSVPRCTIVEWAF